MRAHAFRNGVGRIALIWELDGANLPAGDGSWPLAAERRDERARLGGPAEPWLWVLEHVSSGVD